MMIAFFLNESLEVYFTDDTKPVSVVAFNARLTSPPSDGKLAASPARFYEML